MIPLLSTKQSRLIFAFLVLMFTTVSCGLTPGSSPKEIVVDPLRFSKVVNGYKSADSLKKPLPNSLLFVGSSSIHGWKTLADAFPELSVINRGMGGSHMSDLNYYLNDIVFPYRPNAIVVYEGDNDIASGKSPEIVLADFKLFISQVHAKWAKLPIFFISIKPSIARLDHMENMGRANALIKSFIDENETIYYVDVFNPMLGTDGAPRQDIFKEDGLHMNAEGYTLWAKAIRLELGLE